MTGQMAWYSLNPEGTKELYLKPSLEQPWISYRESSNAIPDYLIPGGSAGYATMQHLQKKGWQLVSSDYVRS